MIDSKIVSFFLENGLGDADFFDFIMSKAVIIPSGSDTFWYGCHPIVEDDVLVDIRLVIPDVVTDKDMQIALHEVMHAWDLFSEIGSKYEENREKREAKAKLVEKMYLRNRR